MKEFSAATAERRSLHSGTKRVRERHVKRLWEVIGSACDEARTLPCFRHNAAGSRRVIGREFSAQLTIVDRTVACTTGTNGWLTSHIAHAQNPILHLL